MNTREFPTDDLELVVRRPAGAARPRPLVFVHGAYAAAWCWDEHFLPYFAAAGYPAYALSLRGHGGSWGREFLNSFSLSDYVEDLERVVAALGVAPVLVGHSMGGMVVQRFMDRHVAAGAAFLASVPPQGLGASALGLAFSKPHLLLDLNRLLGGAQVAPSALVEALFAQPIAAEDLARHYRRMQPESYRAIWDMTLFDVPLVAPRHRAPWLVLGGEADPLIPPALVRLTAHTLDTEPELFPAMGHAMMLERDWEPVARRLLEWLAANDL